MVKIILSTEISFCVWSCCNDCSNCAHVTSCRSMSQDSWNLSFAAQTKCSLTYAFNFVRPTWHPTHQLEIDSSPQCQFASFFSRRLWLCYHILFLPWSIVGLVYFCSLPYCSDAFQGLWKAGRVIPDVCSFSTDTKRYGLSNPTLKGLEFLRIWVKWSCLISSSMLLLVPMTSLCVTHFAISISYILLFYGSKCAKNRIITLGWLVIQRFKHYLWVYILKHFRTHPCYTG